MIKTFEPHHVDEIMSIWLNTNISAHSFVDSAYWQNAAGMVRDTLPSSDLFVYQQDETIKGFVGITGHGYIAGIFVRDGNQSQGVGRKLLNYCKELYPRLELDVFVENERAVRFYEKSGFSIVKRTMNPDFQHEEYHMLWTV